MQLTGYRGIDVLQTPTCHDTVITSNKKACEHAQITYPLPCRAVGEFGVGTGSIGGGMSADDELANHARQSQHQDAGNVNDDEDSSAVLSCHIGKTPHIAQSDGTACRR